ncbi:MAG: hypothetical protein D6828_05225, partial [Nitrospirae bacterium]
MEFKAAQTVFFSEVLFTLVWLGMAMRLREISHVEGRIKRSIILEILIWFVVAATTILFLTMYPDFKVYNVVFKIQNYHFIYFLSLFQLLTVLYSAWQLEQFWRSLNNSQRWEYKTFIVGSYLVCGAVAWSSSYRLTYLVILPKHLLLLTALLSLGWGLVLYGVLKHRLLNRKIFISRKIVYSFVVPSLLAAYLIGFSIVLLIMRTFGLEMSFVLKWFFIAIGFTAILFFFFSEGLRRRVHFFISTHFYINKYEYRDEWLAFSKTLHSVKTEADVVKALYKVLSESLYTREIFIWLGDESSGYSLFPMLNKHRVDIFIRPDDILIDFLKSHDYLYLNEKQSNDLFWKKIVRSRKDLLNSLNIVLLFPITTGKEILGLIGLGPEFTGGYYGHDDFDLLTALSSQAASAILAARTAEKLARVREKQAWDRLSAFVLHDIKNAASMLSLLRENAKEHIHEPEFQQDMLEVVDDALKRMGRVEKRLKILKDEIKPAFKRIDICLFLEECCYKLQMRLPNMEINIK